MTSMFMITLLALGVVGLTVGGLVIGAWVLVRRGGEVRALTERGQLVTGRVVERHARHSRGSAGRHRRIKVAYQLPEGGRHERWISATPEEWESLREGMPVDLVYLPDRPAVFATRRLVDLARQVKKLAPLS